MEILLLEAKRQGYSVDQCGKTMTTGELINWLEQYDENTPIYISNDNGYTYGSIKDYDIREDYIEDDEEEEEE